MYAPVRLFLKAILALAIAYFIADIDFVGLPDIKLRRSVIITVDKSTTNDITAAPEEPPSISSSMYEVAEKLTDTPAHVEPQVYVQKPAEYFDEHNIAGYDANQSFFVYSPSGGLNNQRMEIEYALHISKLLKRTLLVPMLGPHTSLWHNYRKVARSNLCPADFIFDIQNFETYGPKVMPLNCTIDALEQVLVELPQALATIVYHRERRRDWHADEVRSELRPIRSKVVFLKGPTSKLFRFLAFVRMVDDGNCALVFHNWFPPYIITAVRSKSRYTAGVRRLALKLVDASLPRAFNALHLRLGDKGDHGITAKGLTEIMIYRNFSVEDPVYIATEPREIDSRPDLFLPLEEKWKVVYARDLAPQEAMNDFRSHFSPRLRDDMFGVVEQLICTAAYKFKGSPYSRFTQFIGFMRQHKKELFPEYYEREQLLQEQN